MSTSESPKKNPVGRPTLYREEMNKQAYKLSLLGLTDTELAKFFQIDVATLNRWKEAHPKFRASIQDGKEIADAEVVEALYKRAKGMSVVESNKHGETVKELPPDTRAAELWLRNRQGRKWRDKQEVEVTDGNKKAEMQELLASMSPEQKQAKLDELMKLQRGEEQ